MHSRCVKQKRLVSQGTPVGLWRSWIAFVLLGEMFTLGGGGHSVFSAEGEKLPQEMVKVWSSFRAAIAQRDVSTVVRLSDFPIAANDFGGPIKSSNVLKARWSKIFSTAVEGCIAQEEPKSVPGYPGYLVECNSLAFGFKKFGEHFRFSYIDNANAE
jgi:hypothetical protein